MTEITYGAQVTGDNGYHVRFRLHVGSPEGRGLAGNLVLRKEEFDDMVKKLNMEVHYG